MNKTHGNCAVWTAESRDHVYCQKDMIGCWYSKHGNACKCKEWKPRVVELHLKTQHVVAEYYEGDTKPIVVIAHCNDGKRYVVPNTWIVRLRIANWQKTGYHYEEDGIGHYKEDWIGGAMDIVVVQGDEIGAR